jgi:ankyrin repeat protein
MSEAVDAEVFVTPLPLHDALWIVAREYGFASWPKLKAALDVRTESVDRMKQAIDEDDVSAVEELLKSDVNIVNQYVVRAPYYYGNHRPLTYASQRGRTQIVKLLLEAGADIHAEGNLAMARASMSDAHIPIMEMFLARGMDVNCVVYDWGPLITYPAETQAAEMLKWLLKHGANPNLTVSSSRCGQNGWQALIEGYDRSPRFHECVNAMIAGGAKYEDGPCMDLYRGRFREFSARLQRDPAIARNSYDIVGANLPLRGTLLHLCAEWNFREAARSLVARGADVNARAAIDSEGFGGYTPIFHTVNSIKLWGYPMLEWLLAEGADLSVRASVRVWGDKVLRGVTPLGYAIQARRNEAECERVVELLKKYGARE